MFTLTYRGPLWEVARNIIDREHLESMHGFREVQDFKVKYDGKYIRSSAKYKIYPNFGNSLLTKLVTYMARRTFPWFEDHILIELESTAYAPGHVVNIATLPDNSKLCQVFTAYESNNIVYFNVEVIFYGHGRGMFYRWLSEKIAIYESYQRLSEHLPHWEKDEPCYDANFLAWRKQYDKIDHAAIEKAVGQHLIAAMIGEG